MAKQAGEDALLSFSYGKTGGIERDVDRFREFYLACFSKDARFALEARMRRTSWFAAAVCFAGACFCVIPVFVNASSVFAYVILAMGTVLAGTGACLSVRAVRSGERAARDFPLLMESEFASSCSATKRLFDVRMTGEGVSVEFGTTTGVRQQRLKRYGDIEEVAVDGDLLFIKGLTWLCSFNMDEDDYRAACRMLEQRCSDRFRRLS